SVARLAVEERDLRSLGVDTAGVKALVRRGGRVGAHDAYRAVRGELPGLGPGAVAAVGVDDGGAVGQVAVQVVDADLLAGVGGGGVGQDQRSGDAGDRGLGEGAALVDRSGLAVRDGLLVDPYVGHLALEAVAHDAAGEAAAHREDPGAGDGV